MKEFKIIPMAEYRRGDIVFVKNPVRDMGVGTHVICGDHPAVVIQNQAGNDHSPNLIVAFLTSKIKRIEMKTHVLLTWYDGLRPSVIQTEQLMTVDKEAVAGYITHLREEDLVRLDRALLYSLGMEQYMRE